MSYLIVLRERERGGWMDGCTDDLIIMSLSIAKKKRESIGLQQYSISRRVVVAHATAGTGAEASGVSSPTQRYGSTARTSENTKNKLR